jgi:hypothetical protein
VSIVQRFVRRALLFVVGAVTLLYVFDYVWVRAHLPASMQSMTVYPYYDVKQRSGKSEFYMLDPQTRTCVQAIFPHMGSSPCWYLRKHLHQKIDM